MNPLLFANLGSQRRLLEFGSAYATERVVLNIVAGAAAIGCIVGSAIVFKVIGDVPFPLPEGLIMLERIELVAGVLVALGTTYLGWAFMRAFLDMADASIAISLGGSEQQAAAPPPAPRPRGGSRAWPEPPKPLIPVAEDDTPEDRKYMPSSR